MRNKEKEETTKQSSNRVITDEERASNYVHPTRLGKKAKEQADAALLAVLSQRRSTSKPEDRLKATLLQLRFKIEDYLKNSPFEEEKSFGAFLRQYIHELDKQQKDFAREIDIKPAELSGYLNNHRTPPVKIIVRLEIHSHFTIPASDWYQLVEKEKLHALTTDKALRIQEQKFVKKAQLA